MTIALFTPPLIGQGRYSITLITLGYMRRLHINPAENIKVGVLLLYIKYIVYIRGMKQQWNCTFGICNGCHLIYDLKFDPIVVHI